MAKNFLDPGQTQTEESIRLVVARVNAALDLPDSEVGKACRKLESLYQTTMKPGYQLVDRDHELWWDERILSCETKYWDRYRQHLESDKGFSPNVVLKINDGLDNVLDLTGDPEAASLDRRGLVVGQVQSGKTANYTGLICKAADAGYRVFFVIAGIHNNLRAQTQGRIDEGFIGRNSLSPTKGPIGVGLIDQTPAKPISFTNIVHDFKGTHADAIGIDLASTTAPSVFVIKKNPTVLKKLNSWLRGLSANRDGGIPLPALIIDDEADNASIDVGRGNQVSRINSEIRTLLTLFHRSSYVGYTATPFANIFIDPRSDHLVFKDDLFPRSFIIALEPPSNYHGPERIFGDEDAIDTHVIKAEDYADVLPLNHKRTHSIAGLPDSLEYAIDTWFVATAIRHLRHDGSFHSTMMINVSRFVDIQSKVSELVRLQVDAIIRAIKAKSRVASGKHDSLIARLHRAFTAQYLDCGHPWDDVLYALADATLSTKVKVINGSSPDTLDYRVDNGRYIAIGGLSLSRGLTLEGLTVTYFLRNSKMYDTLMQMGRWFGYRPGYEDLVRIWLTAESSGWYEHITGVVTELRDELKDMQKAGGTPMDFGLKVRTDPDVLTITARNKMGSGESYMHSTSLSNKWIEAHQVPLDEPTQQKNLSLGIEWLGQIDQDQSERTSHFPVGSGRLFRNVPKDFILRFLTEYQSPSGVSPNKDSKNIRRFLTATDDQKLESWSVFVPFGDGALITKSPLAEHTALLRSNGTNSSTSVSIGDKQRVSGRGIEAAGLDTDTIDRIRDTRSDRKPADSMYRAERPEPLFMLFFVDLRKASSDQCPLVSFGISIPPHIANGKTVEYMVNQTYQEQQLRLFEELAKDDEADEETE